MTTPPTLGLRHVALRVPDDRYEATARFYREGLGMAVDWQPDADALYLSSGSDNLALHRTREPLGSAPGALDHLGFLMPTAEVVAQWHERLSAVATDFGIEIIAPLKRHRDGATSFYLRDPAGTVVQMVHIPGVKT